MTRLRLVLVVLALAGCSGVHLASSDDAGPILADGQVPVTEACRLASPPPTPTFAGEGCYCDGPFVVFGTIAYRQSYDLEVIDVSTPGAPRLVGQVMQEAVQSAGVAIVGDVLFAAGGALERFDLTTPLAPVSMGTIDVGGNVGAIASVGDRLLVAIRREDGTSAIVPIDVSDPRAVVVGTAFDLGALSPWALATNGAIVFAGVSDGTIVGGPQRLVAIDVADVHAARMVGAIDAPVSYGTSLALHGDRLFLASFGAGVREIDVSSPAAMQDRGMIVAGITGSQGIAVAGDVLVVSSDGLALFDLTSPSLAPLGHTDETASAVHATIAGGQLLGSNGGALFSVPLRCD